MRFARVRSEAEKDASVRRDQYRALLREIREHARDLCDSLSELAAEAQKRQKDERRSYVQRELKGLGPDVTRHRAAINGLFTECFELLRSDPGLRDDVSDMAVRAGNVWLRAEAQLPRANGNGTADADDQVIRAGRAGVHLKRLIYECAFQTIPSRVNEHLRGMRVGQALIFEREFKDELDSKEQRDEILVYLRDHPLDVNGVVYPEQGLIRAASASSARRMASVTVLLLPLAFGAALFGLLELPGPAGRGLRDGLLLSYLAIFAGVVAHWLVDGLKQWRSGSGTPSAIADAPQWLHVNETTVLVGIVTVIVGWVGLVFNSTLGDEPLRVDPMLAFVSGYSIDSVVDVFLQRFQTGMAGRSDALRAQLTSQGSQAATATATT